MADAALAAQLEERLQTCAKQWFDASPTDVARLNADYTKLPSSAVLLMYESPAVLDKAPAKSTVIPLEHLKAMTDIEVPAMTLSRTAGEMLVVAVVCQAKEDDPSATFHQVFVYQAPQPAAAE